MKFNENYINKNFIQLINDIEEDGDIIAPRGLKVKELLMKEIHINPFYSILDFPDRPFNFKYFAGELNWYLTKERSIDKILPFSKFWKNISNNNLINSNYGNLLFGKQLFWAYNALKDDINTRQSIAFLNKPEFQIIKNKDFVCSMYLNFFIRDNKLHMKLTMRSNDIFFGLTYDAPFFALIHQHMYLWLKKDYPHLQLGTYIHYADNIHFYEKHFDIAKKISKTKEYNNYSLILKRPMFELKPGASDSVKYVLYSDTIVMMSRISEAATTDASFNDYKTILSDFIDFSY